MLAVLRFLRNRIKADDAVFRSLSHRMKGLTSCFSYIIGDEVKIRNYFPLIVFNRLREAGFWLMGKWPGVVFFCGAGWWAEHRGSTKLFSAYIKGKTWEVRRCSQLENVVRLKIDESLDYFLCTLIGLEAGREEIRWTLLLYLLNQKSGGGVLRERNMASPCDVNKKHDPPTECPSLLPFTPANSLRRLC